VLSGGLSVGELSYKVGARCYDEFHHLSEDVHTRRFFNRREENATHGGKRFGSKDLLHGQIVRPLYSHHDMGKTLKYRAKNPNQGINLVKVEYLNFVFPPPKPKPICPIFPSVLHVLLC
jgi:hypothetical protein